MATEFDLGDLGLTGVDVEGVLKEARRIQKYIRQARKTAETLEKMGEHAEADHLLENAASAQTRLDELVAKHSFLRLYGDFGSSGEHDAATPNTTARAIVTSALVIAGAILLSVVLVTGAGWYYAEMMFVLAAYLVWQHWL